MGVAIPKLPCFQISESDCLRIYQTSPNLQCRAHKPEMNWSNDGCAERSGSVNANFSANNFTFQVLHLFQPEYYSTRWQVPRHNLYPIPLELNNESS
jgi:hypothetical protein